MLGIYKVTSPSGKVYIGQSTDIHKRWKGHKWKQGLGLKMLRSYNKYGYENHIFEVIEECSSDKLDERELFWINFYNSIRSGLNGTACVQGGYHSEETKRKISEAQKGRVGHYKGKKRPDHSKFMIALLKSRGGGYKRSEETKKLLSEHGKKMIMCRDILTGTVIRVTKEQYSSNENLVGVTSNMRCDRRRKLILCIELNDLTEGIRETIAKYNIATNTLYSSIRTGCKVLKDKYPETGGLTFTLIPKV